MTVPIDGTCDPAFIGIRDAFVTNFAERGEVGASVCVIVDGRVVVDLWGGHADEARSRPWRRDTIANFYSAGKALVGLLALREVDAGRLALDEPIARVWPEFAVGGKDVATVRHALCHRAGVPAIRARMTNDDLWHWDRMVGALAATEAWFEPGSRHVYHTNTYGHLVGELVHRASGRMPADALRQLVGPLDADVQWSVPMGDQHRCAEVIWAPQRSMADLDPDALEGEARMVVLGYVNPPGYSSQGVVNTPEWRAAQVPSTNGHGTGRGLAQVYAALVEPGRLLTPDLLAEATRVQSDGHCPVLGEEVSFGLGFVPTTERRPLGPNPHSFGHFGTGGAVGFADPDAGVAFGYVMNHVIPRWQSTRNRSMIEALYAAL